GVRIGGYAAQHPEKVEKLLLYAPRYVRLDPSDPPRGLPEPGVPTAMLAVDDFADWDTQVKCEDQFSPVIREVISRTRLEFDPLGSTWGRVGVKRSPAQGTLFGWNPTVAPRIQAPTLIITGDLDPAPVTNVTAGRNLYNDLLVDNKVFVHVACASHYLVWENR